LQALDLYAKIESDLEFKEEIQYLYSMFLETLLEHDIKKVIDIGCGQGEFCILLSQNEIDSIGVDLSQKQVEYALQKGVDARCCDIKDITQQFQAATATFDVINYLSKNELKKFLQHCYKIVQDNGYLIFDINTLHGFENIAQGSLNIDKEDRFIAIDAYYENSKLQTNITLFTKQESLYNKQSGTIIQYFYPVDYLTILLKSIGFKWVKTQEVYLHDDETPDKMILIAHKGKQ
jgi:cyclopropane fatty-acyl-phospholipid synthase-like methyltransferase